MLHALQPDQPVGKLGHLSRFAVHDQDFKTGVVVQMRMAGGDHHFVVRVLRLSQFLCDTAGVVVVDEGHRAHHGRVRSSGLLGHQPVADQIAKRLRPVGIAAPPDQAVKPLE